jgi:amino acid permease
MLLSGDPVGRAATRIESTFGSSVDWLINESGEALFGLSIAAAIFGGLVLLRTALLRFLPQEIGGQPSLIRALVQRVFVLFLAAVAFESATHAVAPPGALMWLADTVFVVAMAVQGALAPGSV